MVRNKTIRVKTRKVKGGKTSCQIPERIGLMNPTWGGELHPRPLKGIKSKLKKTRRNKIKN